MHGGAGSLLPGPQAAQTPHLLFSVEHLVEITVVGLTVRHRYHLQGRGKNLLLEPDWTGPPLHANRGSAVRVLMEQPWLGAVCCYRFPVIMFGGDWGGIHLVWFLTLSLKNTTARKNEVCSLGDPGAELQLPTFVSREQSVALVVLY